MHLAASIVLGCYVPVALAADASVTISSPQEGAKISPKEVNVTYEIVLGPNSNHAHLYVDNGEPVIIRALKGSHTVGTLAPGKHSMPQGGEQGAYPEGQAWQCEHGVAM